MFDWIVPIIIGGAGSVRSLASATVEAFRKLIDLIFGTFARWASALWWFGIGVAGAYNGFIDFIAALGNWALVLLLYTLPNRIANAVNTARTYADIIAGSLRNLIRSTVDSVVTWVRGEIGKLSAWATAEFRVVIDNLDRAWRLLTATAARVAQLLTNPRALADWIAGFIIQATFRWLLGNAEALARWALAVAIRGAVGFAAVAERIIVDIFL